MPILNVFASAANAAFQSLRKSSFVEGRGLGCAAAASHSCHLCAAFKLGPWHAAIHVTCEARAVHRKCRSRGSYTGFAI
jgi:hypothetical protein